MPFKIVPAPEAIEDLRALRANDRAKIRTALETHLRHAPEKVSRTRIKRLRRLRQPQDRLRVGEARIFYDVVDATVQVLAMDAQRSWRPWNSASGAYTPNGIRFVRQAKPPAGRAPSP